MMKKKLYIFIVIILSFLIFATYKIFIENKTIVEKDTILAMDTQISWVIYEKPSLYPLDLNAKIKTRIDELVKEKEEKPNEIKETIENTPTIKEGDSGEIVASIVAKELEDFRNERKKEKEENEVKNYKEEILENKPWFKETFKSLQSKGALTSKKEIDNIVLTLDGLLKERWDEKNTASSAGMSIEELNKLASNKEPEKELTDEQKKLQKKKEQQNMYAKKYNDMLVKIYD